MSQIVRYPTTLPQFNDTKNITLQKILQVITGGGSSGTISGLTSGAVDPTSSPTNTGVDNIYRNTLTGTMWWWAAGGSSWSQFV